MAVSSWRCSDGFRGEGFPTGSSRGSYRINRARFESRFSTVRILDSPAIMLERDGRFHPGHMGCPRGRTGLFPRWSIMRDILKKDLAPIRFVDDDGVDTETYPLNPNGSPVGITGLCSPDGRHLAMMPHPERTFLKWQWAYMPEEWRKNIEASPWLKIFQNAREWCQANLPGNKE